MQHKHACPEGQFKKSSKRGKFTEPSKVKLISQSLGTNLDLEMLSRIKKKFWCGAGSIWKTCIIYLKDQSKSEFTVQNLDNDAIMKGLACFVLKLLSSKFPPSAHDYSGIPKPALFLNGLFIALRVLCFSL